MPELARSAHPVASSICRNCGNRGHGHFCQECGQSYATHRISFPHLLHEVFHLFTHLDKGFLYTLKELIRLPGDMQREYLAGQRYRHQKPFSMFFVAITVTALGQYFIKALVFKLYGMSDDSQDYFRHYFSLMQMALLPLYAFITWLFFRKSEYNYAEIAVLVLYSLSLVIFVVLLLNISRLLFPNFETEYIELPFIVAYNTITYFRLFPADSRWLIVSKSLLINTACFALSHVAAELVVHLLEK
ncbi:DUF3667 domain-containing protein [Hymenobacter weizhouensis]|uniref:DUF3667 domain-containing protein n=1 Tax=Hymenobacter sp. YIM 151500-1 TaxID=2987689 RepID=UPI00222777D3|nr:DUF3667 domain-containing protein [Hymenobacter sp. YIM 151500-1]UYZ61490.1 DUF3667 domain-containing protein [Hymenobacter sp. YIM 151500-1]